LVSQPDDCLFCRIVRDGPHLSTTPGFIAISDVHPQAPVHLLVIPSRHVESFREIDAFSPEESARMLGFISETARAHGLEDYRVLANVGPSAGQSVFHLHWHILGEPGARVAAREGERL
jgi:histidine triad (HIT) family protein